MSQDFARSEDEHEQLFRNVDLRGKSAGYVCQWLSYTKPRAFAQLAQAISRNDSSLTYAILRRWGVRREDVAAALSSDFVRGTDLREWPDAEKFSE